MKYVFDSSPVCSSESQWTSTDYLSGRFHHILCPQFLKPSKLLWSSDTAHNKLMRVFNAVSYDRRFTFVTGPIKFFSGSLFDVACISAVFQTGDVGCGADGMPSNPGNSQSLIHHMRWLIFHSPTIWRLQLRKTPFSLMWQTMWRKVGPVVK